VVNQAFAERFFAGRDPLGETVIFAGRSRHQVVGVVGNARYRSIEQAADPTFYVPLEQNDERWPFLSFTAWTDGDAATLAPAIRTAVRDVDGNQPISRIRTYDEILRTGLAPRRFNTLLVGLFALAALLLAAVGTYGVMAYGVSTRTREIGVRAALGARPRDLARLIVSEGLTVTMIAVAIGVAGGLAATGLLSGMLYQVAPRDPKTFVLVACVLTLVAVFASWMPARRATRVNPISALREE
jgi:predicted lysophospholipase L1 biosynthesis ABC-type transport system permease subunit